jgi:hypothetical protein
MVLAYPDKRGSIMKALQLIAAALLLGPLGLHNHAYAQQRCPAGSSGCTVNNAPERIQQRVNQGARDVIRNRNPVGRVQEVKDALRDCIECGMDAVRKGADSVSEGSR